MKFTRLYELPTAEQIMEGRDMNNFKAAVVGTKDLSGQDSYSSLQILDLKPKTVYAIFFSLSIEQDGFTLTSLKDDTVAMIIETLDPKVYNNTPLTYLAASLTALLCFVNLI